MAGVCRQFLKPALAAASKHREYRDEDGHWASVDNLRRRLSAPDATTLPSYAPEAAPSVSALPVRAGTVEDRLAGKLVAQALFGTLVQRLEEAIGSFSTHANSKHIILSNKHAFAAISVLQTGLRIGLWLDLSEVERNPRLRAQPRGVFEGWNALHVSTALSSETDIDQELLNLLKRAYESAG